MHDEDNKRGLMVRSLDRSEPWMVCGDGHLLDSRNGVAIAQCKLSLQASVDEVYDAWTTGFIPPDHHFRAWAHAPRPDSIKSLDNFAPMFNEEGQIRSPLVGPGPFTYCDVGSAEWVAVRQQVNPGDKDDTFPARLRVEAEVEEGRAKVEASAAKYEMKDDQGGQHRLLGGKVGLNVGAYTGYDFGVQAYSYDGKVGKATVGLNWDTGAGYRNEGVEVKVIGTGVSIGRETGISIWGSSIKFKLWLSELGGKFPIVFILHYDISDIFDLIST